MTVLPIIPAPRRFPGTGHNSMCGHCGHLDSTPTGTTLVAARRLNRRFFGIDSNPDAKRVFTERITSP